MTAQRAVIGAWLVAVFFFTVLHGRSELALVVNLVIVLGLYGLLYVHTGQLALPIGIHTGVNFVGGALVVSPAIAGDRVLIIEVTNSLSGVLGSLNAGAVPQVVIAYILAVLWLTVRGRPVSVAAALAHWSER